MKVNNIKLVQSTLMIILIVFPCIFALSCNHKDDKPAPVAEKTGTTLIDYDASLALYYPLTVEKLNSILNSNEPVGLIVLDYYAWTTPDPNELSDLVQLGFDAGAYLDENIYGQLSGYRGGLVKEQRSIDPTDYNFFEHSFTKEEIQNIFDYMIANADYFFNAAEYNGAPSWSADFMCIGDEIEGRNFCFCMSIDSPGNPGTYPIPAWAISKCVYEYPEPGTPLYGLFQMLENDFIPQFEEE